ncbi:glycosyltransferase family 2 protein [Terrabacter sp. NPDC000476]|uniref:glycosyltransferase family 2 protein n=1 Tax=Terrabacter sp. NPDC000476 TaxID=3154258 RepID=UPI003321697B
MARQREAWDLGAGRALAPADPDVTLSVVVPFYNPGDALAPTLARLAAVLDATGHTYEVIAVSDGSTDGSERTVVGLHPRVRVDVADRNRGKGAALRRGFAQSRGSYVAFIDADGDICPSHVPAYLEAAMVGGHPVVYADKRHHESVNPSTTKRRVISWTFSTVVTTLFAVEARDTQTGCKVLHRDALAAVFPYLREEGFALDLELFVALGQAGRTGSLGMPVAINERLAGSTISTGSIVRTLKDTLRVFGRCHVGRAYAPARTGTPPAGVASLHPHRTEAPHGAVGAADAA